MSHESQSLARNWSSRAGRHWRNRKLYGRSRDWLWSLYNRLLISRIGRFFPLRGYIRPIHLVQLEKPLWIRLGTTDWLVLEEIFVRGEYDAVLKENLENVLQVVDLGSNIGLSIRLWQAHYPKAQIVGVEPDERNLEICRRNTQEAGGNPVKLVRACIAAHPRTVYLKRERGEWAFSMTDQQTGEAGVPAKTIPQILTEAGMSGPIDLLKCDIEGAEQELFADCSAWIKQVRHLLVELHHPYTKASFLEDLERCGGRFDHVCVDEGHGYDVLLLRRLM